MVGSPYQAHMFLSSGIRIGPVTAEISAPVTLLQLFSGGH